MFYLLYLHKCSYLHYFHTGDRPILNTTPEDSTRLGEHSTRLREHSTRFSEHSTGLREHSTGFSKHSTRFKRTLADQAVSSGCMLLVAKCSESSCRLSLR
jgi:hypothetical protein